MKKKFTILMMLLSLIGGVNLSSLRAQTDVTFNFNDASLEGWETFQGLGAAATSGSCPNWQISPTLTGMFANYYKGLDNTNCIVSLTCDASNGGNYKPDNYIVTESAYTVTESTIVSWYVKVPSGSEYYELLVSSDKEEWTVVFSETLPVVSSATQKQSDLSAYAGQTLYIGFRHYGEKYNTTDGSHISVDEIVFGSVISGGSTPDPDPEPEEPTIPAAPTLAAEATGQTTIALSWDAVNGATSYKVYNNETVIASELTVKSYEVTGLTANTEYCYTVTAVNEIGESEKSAETCVTTWAPVPATPTGLTATAVDDKSITLAWTASQYATTYNIYDNNSVFIAEVTETTYTVTGLDAETEYCFAVSAENKSGESVATQAVCATTLEFVVPDEPVTKTIGTGNTTGRMPANMYSYYSVAQQIFTKEEIDFVPGAITKISFQASSTYACTRLWTIYMVNVDKESFDGNNDWVSVTNADIVYDGTITTGSGWLEINLQNSFIYTGNDIVLCVYDHTGSEQIFNFYTDSNTNQTLKYDSYYPISVDALNGNGSKYTSRSQFRFVIEAADELEPATPTNLAATANDDGTITLTWDVAENAMSYNVYQNDIKVATVVDPSYTAQGLEYETEYCYYVKSQRFTKESEASETVCETTPEKPIEIEFVLMDSYGDGWDKGRLTAVFDDGVTEPLEMTLENGSSEKTFTVTVGKCVTVAWTYYYGDYPDENSFVIRYKNGDIIHESGQMSWEDITDTFLTTCDMEQPQNLVADNTELYSGETTTITWDAYEGAVSYNVYVNGVKVNEEAVTETSYELSELPYITSGNTIAVTAVVGDRESPKSAPVYVKVAGTFNLVLNVKDNESNPIAEAMVTITGYDEFDVQKNYEFTTDENGMVEETLPLPLKETQFSIEVSKAPYEKGYSDVTNYNWSGYVENGSTVTREVTLRLTGVNQIDTDKEYYVAGEDIILYWDAVEGATGYNVYEKYYDAEYNEVFTKLNGETLLTSTLYIIEDGLQYRENGNTICVTAVYDDLGESEKGYGKSIDVNDYGTVTGVVTDGINAIEGATVTIEGRDQFNNDQLFTFTTAEDGTFSGDVLYGDKWGSNTYTATISKSGYETQVVENVIVTFESPEYEFETIVLTAEELPEATINNLTATVNNSQVDISWAAEYDSYNVYRNEASVGVYQLGTISTESYSDTDWAELPNGSYYYGVAAMIYQGMGAIIEENCEAMEFQPDWTTTDNWSFGYSNIGEYNASLMSYQWYSGGEKYYMILPPMSPANSSLTFSYLFYDYGYSGSKELDVYYATSEDGPWTNSLFHKTSTEVASDTWHESGEINLSAIKEETIYIAFCHTDNGFGPMYIDNIVVNGPIYEESEITWTSSAIVKNDANVFTGTGNWTTEANWSNGLPASGATVFIEGNVTIASDVNVNVNNMTIINGGSVTINDGASLTVNGTLVNEAAANLVINDGAQIFQNNEDVPATFVMGIAKPEEWQSDNKDGWQFISSPFTNASVFNFTNASEGDYDLFKYDGDEDLEWRNHKANAASFGPTFEQGVGYLASHETESTIELTGTLNAENSYSWNYLYYNEEKPLANFYLLGNPFTFDMDITKATFTNLVEGVAVVTSVGGYDYSQTTIPVGDAFFVKANGNDYSSSLSYGGGRGARSAQSNSLNITATGNAGKDNVVINFAGKSEGFDKLQNFNDAIATVYVAEDGKNYGIYNCDADVQEVELSFNANKMGNYTISIEPNGKFQTVTLVDRFTGVETNMLEGEYTFTAMSGDNHNRFVVRFANGQESTDDSHFVYQSGEELILNIQGDVQILDVLGRVVYSGEAMNDINRINVSSFNSGAYMVRVMNGNDVKVEKVVIY